MYNNNKPEKIVLFLLLCTANVMCKNINKCKQYGTDRWTL